MWKIQICSEWFPQKNLLWCSYYRRSTTDFGGKNWSHCWGCLIYNVFLKEWLITSLNQLHEKIFWLLLYLGQGPFFSFYEVSEFWEMYWPFSDWPYCRKSGAFKVERKLLHMDGTSALTLREQLFRQNWRYIWATVYKYNRLSSLQSACSLNNVVIKEDCVTNYF